MRRLIVNADDFGRGVGCTRGILAAHRDGIVTSTTCMVNLPWSEDAAQQARQAQQVDLPTLGIGLHLNFCYGAPLTGAAVPSLLAADGLLMRDLPRLREQMQANDIEREARAQLARFWDLFHRNPTHLDSHQHVHGMPVAAPVVLALAQEIGCPMRASSPQQAAQAHAAGVPTPLPVEVGFFGAEHLLTVEALVTLLRSLPTGTSELMCHPGYSDEALADSSYTTQREIELATLCDPAIRQVLIDERITLITFADLTR